MRRIALLPLALVVAAACSDQGPEEGSLRDEIQDHLAVWQDVRPASYSYVVERLCFCGVEARGPARVTVQGASVTDRTYVDGGAPVPTRFAELFPTVDGLFAVLLEAVDENAHDVRVTWDEATGAPVDVWIDYDDRIADEEVGFRIVSLPE